MSHLIIFRAYLSFRGRDNGDVEAAIGLRYQKSLSCPCRRCTATLERFQTKFRGLKLSGAYQIYTQMDLTHRKYYQLLTNNQAFHLEEVSKEVLVPDPDIQFQSTVEDEESFPVS